MRNISFFVKKKKEKKKILRIREILIISIILIISNFHYKRGKIITEIIEVKVTERLGSYEYE